MDFANNKEACDAVIKLIAVNYSESLNEFSAMDEQFYDTTLLGELVMGCKNLKTIRVSSYSSRNWDELEPLKTMFPHIEWIFKALIEDI